MSVCSPVVLSFCRSVFLSFLTCIFPSVPVLPSVRPSGGEILGGEKFGRDPGEI